MPAQYSPWADPRLVAQNDPQPEMTEEQLLMAQGLGSNGAPYGIDLNQNTPNQDAQKIAEHQQALAMYQQGKEKEQELITQQQRGVDQLQQYADNYQNIKTGPDLSGIAALADAWGVKKSNFAGSYKRPPTEQERAASIFELQSKLQERKEALTKSQYQALQNNITAMKANKSTDLADELTKSKIKFYGSNNRQALLNQQQSVNTHNQVVNKITNDKMLGQRVNQVNNLDNALSAFEQGTATPQQFSELQQAIRSNMGMKGSGGVAEREETYLKSIGLSAAVVKQFITGNPQDVRNYIDPAMVEHVKKLVGIEKSNIKKQADQRLKALSAGHESMYQKNPNLRKDREEAAQAAAMQFEEVSGTPAKNTEDLSKMSNEELEAYIKSHGG